MKKYEETTKTNAIFLAMVAVVIVIGIVIGTLVYTIPTMQQVVNAQYKPSPPYSDGGGVIIKPFSGGGGLGQIDPNESQGNALHSNQHRGSNTQGPHTNSTSSK